jgi:hypothetical protein
MDNDKDELHEALDLIEQLLGMSCLDDMIKDLKKSEKPDDEEFMGYCIALREQTKDFMEKHAKQEGETA